jgi:hypothetical protein
MQLVTATSEKKGRSWGSFYTYTCICVCATKKSVRRLYTEKNYTVEKNIYVVGFAGGDHAQKKKKTPAFVFSTLLIKGYRTR